jgi:16S rRNA (guanine527-N7)-methyltransferase
MTRDQFIRDLTNGSAEMGVQLDAKSRERLYLFYGELRKWNLSINLVSRIESDWVKVHFLDSLAPLGLGLISGSERIVDLGAGAGFPGVPIKVVCPGMALVLVEASGAPPGTGRSGCV